MIVVVPLGGVVESGAAPLGGRTSASRWCASVIATCRSVGCRLLDLLLPGVIKETSCVSWRGVTSAFGAASPQLANKTEPLTKAAATDLAVLVMSCKALDGTIRVSL
jgi:hypothetical protein